ncbi:FadR/GntR family transcriptional regulator [Leifsonia naganoensis]|uniref:DNA-binding FadR family transcriptional regulator n=1 Tax=Leifsonia naganoensis TaxID=150025 RepID=A0A853DLG5_9MICO|nr:FadR/GntR family transcriptional regulator [Leifsonia naganoensis]NYK09278.1 DNA-binding FadR family transcriptional regulator [Leifsonia naganoensis]
MTASASRSRQDVVAESVGRDIVSGRRPSGEVLPREDDLCTAHGVSRTTVRGAMAVLAGKGLIEIRRKTGTVVRPRPEWDVFDSDLWRWAHAEGSGEDLMAALVELRRVIEPEAARLAAQRATLAELADLERAARELTAAVHDRAAYPEWDAAFHQAVFVASHNPLLVRFGALVGDVLRIAFAIQQDDGRSSVDLATDAARHVIVLDALRDGDAEAAAAAMLEVVLDGPAPEEDSL